MKPIKVISVVFLCCFFHFQAASQLQITDGNTAPFNPQNLVKNVFLGSGVEVVSTQYTGDNRAVGFFSGGMADINLERGILLSTSRSAEIASPNNTTEDLGADDVTTGGTVDEDLELIATDVLNNVARYTIKFIPAADTLRFRYVFASEEYPEFVCAGFNDVFGFFISGPNPDGGTYDSRNIALVPDPNDPQGLTFTNTVVAIDNVHDGSAGTCDASFPEFYNINPPGNPNFKLDAYTDVFISEAVVIPCEEYIINLSIADVGDDQYGSAVFLEAKSFGTGTLEVELNSLSVDGSLAEGCGTGELEFKLPEVVDRDYVIDIEFFNPPNAATPGQDYPEIPSQLIIPAGSSSISVPLEAFLDGESEVDEVISFEIQVDLCNRKRFEILIRDDDLFDPILPRDTTICSGETYLLESMLNPDFILPEDPYFEETNELIISPEMNPIYSDIIVSGVIPTILTPNIIESVCIQGLEHRTLHDLDIYLISPGGQILELTTDNGFEPNSISNIDRYENTCFTPFATVNINNGNNVLGSKFADNPNYTGEFAPEGVWSDLWDGENPTNGTWRLLLIDDEIGVEGTLEGWSITFRSFYGLTYEWSSDPAGPICENCEDISVTPLVETEYTLKIIDSYGCERSASTLVAVDPSLDTPIPTCGQITENSIEVLWSNIINNQGYEIRLDGGPWIDVASENYTFLTLASSSDFIIEVRAVGPQCNSQPGQLDCRTLDCAAPAILIDIDSEVTCAGTPNGAVTLTATGSAPFSYEVNGLTNTSGIFTNVPKGEITYSVTDMTGCVASGTFIMNGPDAFVLLADYELSDPCNVVSDITGSFQVTGGTAPYSFTWSTGSIISDAPNLSPGIYQVSISDFNGCDTIAELEIPVLQQFAWDVSTSAPLCKDEENGLAQVNITSGNGPFTYLWEDGSTDPTNLNLGEGNHVVTVTDALGCEETRLFSVSEGAILELDISPVDASCLGQSDGSASVVVTGGQEDYSYFWNGGTSDADSTEGLSAGEYILFVSDANNCMISQSFTIDEPDGMTFALQKMDNLCFNDTSASITLTNVNSPNGTVSAFWDDGTVGLQRANLPNGTYCFTLEDGTVCAIEECVEIESPAELSITEMISDLSCVDSQDGEIGLVVQGGSGSYSYTWSGPDEAGPLDAQSNLTALVAGEYSVTISDENNCSISNLYSVQTANPIMIDSSVFDISCNGDNSGKIFFAASGGTPPFTYEWSGPSSFTASTNNIDSVPAGKYTVLYTDSNGCEDTQVFEILEPSLPLKANISPLDTVCFGLGDGVLSVNPSGGTSPYSVAWSDGGSLLENNDLTAGTYEVTVTDGRNCINVETGEVREQEKINIMLEQSASRCSETDDGAAAIIGINYGDSAASLNNFMVEWNTNPPQNEFIASGLTGGRTYSVLVRDRLGCEGEEAITVGSPEPVEASIEEKVDVQCFGNADGSLVITGTGGTGEYTYLWDGNAGMSVTNVAEKLSRGSYQVTVTDGNGCEGVTVFTIDEPRPLNLDFRKIEVSCFSGSDGRAEAVVTGGTVPYRYSWSNGSGAQAVENVVSDWYAVTVTDGNGCLLEDSTLVFQPSDPISVSLDIEEVTCFGGRDGRLEIEAEGGSGFYTYSLDGHVFSSTSIFPNLNAGDYTLLVKDFKGCTDTFTDVLILEPDELIVDLGPDLIINFGNTVELSPSVKNAQGSLSYNWRSANLDFLSCSTCLQPTFDGSREASFELVVVDEQGCRGNDFITIRLENFSPLFVPTAFTPNDDGENDVLELFGRGIRTLKNFAIYDKWGELVYSLENLEMEDVYLSWDGVFKGKEAPSGIYYWFAEVEFQNGFSETFNGNTTLIK